MSGQALVIGIGNEDRADDAVGLYVARALRTLAPPDLPVVETGGDALALIEWWSGASLVIVADAAEPCGQPGRIHRLDATEGHLQRDITLSSTHGFGLAGAVELARTLDLLPKHLIVYAIEAASFTQGASLTPSVAAAVSNAAERIATELGHVITPESARHA